MARRPKAETRPQAPDQIEDIALPREAETLVGHAAAETALLDAYRHGRMHHAWLICGDEGIGKASLAFRMARFVLANPDAGSGTVRDAADLYVPADHPAAVKIAHGTHANVLHIQREWDDRGKKFRSELTIEPIRRIIPFLGTTAGEGDWRTIIIDPADEMNRNAANAVLKALEEPPARTLFFLISSTPGRLLPTIRSRCRLVSCQPLNRNQLMRVIEQHDSRFADRKDRDLVLALAAGSPRRALEIIADDGPILYNRLIAAMAQPTFMNMSAVADLVAKSKTRGSAQFTDLFTGYLGRRVRGAVEPDGSHRAANLPLATWAALWEKAARSSRDAEIYNLDVRHFVLDILETYANAVRQQG